MELAKTELTNKFASKLPLHHVTMTKIKGAQANIQRERALRRAGGEVVTVIVKKKIMKTMLRCLLFSEQSSIKLHR